MLIDSVTVQIIAGSGGDGSVHFRRDGQTAKGGPDGGRGGNGGSIFVRGSGNVTDLQQFRYKKIIKAPAGINGKGQNMYGRNAEDITLLVPLGTSITDTDTGKVTEVTDETNEILLARGGKGGRGNNDFKSATNQTPTYRETGEPGENKTLRFDLKIIAQVGLIGLPNAGKSSLLSALTNAHPKIADYPFTTLEPNLGMLGKIAIADVPGLIKGASRGRGLGIHFLRHIEKTKVLLHCIDLSNTAPKTSYNTIRRELAKFSSALLDKPEYIVLTKSDLTDEKTIDSVRTQFSKIGKKIFVQSVYNPQQVNTLKDFIKKLLTGP